MPKYEYNEMTAVIVKTSDWNYREIKTFTKLEKLMEFIQESEHSCIITPPRDKAHQYREEDKLWTVEIYDDWRE